MYSQPPASLPGQVVVQSKCLFPKLKGNGKINQTIIGSLFSDITPILLGNYLPREVSGGRQEMREKQGNDSEQICLMIPRQANSPIYRPPHYLSKFRIVSDVTLLYFIVSSIKWKKNLLKKRNRSHTYTYNPPLSNPLKLLLESPTK